METPARRGKIAILAVLGVVTIAGLGLRVGYAVEQPAVQPPDAGAYARIAESLYRDGSFDARPPGVSREIQPTSSYAPGLPLFVAGLYELSGGVHLTLALVVLALLGAGAIPLTYLLGNRMAGPVAGLVGAAALAIYPALLDYQGLLLTEPLAAFLLSAALVTFLYAADRPSPWRWLCGGALLGALALVRPEYLAVAFLLPLAWLVRETLRGRLRHSAALAGVSLLGTALVLAPWTIRNAIVLDRAVPISTGGGKALFIGTYLKADGDGPKLRELLLSERPALRERLSRGGPVDDPDRFVLERVLSRVAAERYPGLETDAALGRMGRTNLEDDFTQEPVAFAGMLVDKAYESWTDSARAVMEREPWRALQLGTILLALLGLAVLALRRRFEAAILGLVLAYMTAIGALLIASPRRELVVLPVLAALAGTGTISAYEWLRERIRH
jgi:4-amino-4-deoxy-L-arabinose transferase-like glycosyltransferase